MSIITVVGATPFLHGATPLPYLIYALHERATGLNYVGLTTRTLAQRISAHLAQARRDRNVRPGGLMTALRGMLASGGQFADFWDVRIVEQAATTDEARAMERYWIATLSAASPTGYNLMPGGASVGGPANSTPITVILPDGSSRTYACIQDAIADSNTVSRDAGMPTLLPGTAYARLSFGWSPAQALGYAPHVDGRGARPLITIKGQTFSNLRSIATTTGVTVSTLRSRLHRRTQSGSGADLVTDMRCSGFDQLPRRSPPLGLRLPGTSQALSVREYAERTDTPASTIQHRWHAAIRAGLDPATMSPAALLDYLVTGKDRRRLITLRLPDGRSMTGGERELVRRVLSDPDLAASRATPLSESGIRRRLRLLPECGRQDLRKVAAAFGFGPVGEEI